VFSKATNKWINKTFINLCFREVKVHHDHDSSTTTGKDDEASPMSIREHGSVEFKHRKVQKPTKAVCDRERFSPHT
jgi:hypothetical protein